MGCAPVVDLKTRRGSLDSDGQIDVSFRTTNNSQRRLSQALGFSATALESLRPVAGQRLLNRRSVLQGETFRLGVQDTGAGFIDLF